MLLSLRTLIPGRNEKMGMPRMKAGRFIALVPRICSRNLC
jgi:hypothetical protein